MRVAARCVYHTPMYWNVFWRCTGCGHNLVVRTTLVISDNGNVCDSVARESNRLVHPSFGVSVSFFGNRGRAWKDILD